MFARPDRPLSPAADGSSRRLRLDCLVIVGAAAIAGYAIAVAGAAVEALRRGLPLDGGLLVQWPVSANAPVVVPIFAAVFVAEALCLGWAESSLCRLLWGRSASHRTDLFYFAVHLLGVGPLLLAVATLGLGAGLEALAALPPSLRLAADMSVWSAALLFFVLDALLTYWMHRLMHTPRFWPFHATHHAADEMTAVTTLRHHPLDNLLVEFLEALAASVLGFPVDAVFAAAVASGLVTTVLHTRLPLPAWIEQHVIAGPRLHGIHHSSDPADHDSNFALIPLFDRLFGTYRWHDRPLTFGVGDRRFDTGRPLHDLVAVYAIWWSGMRSKAHASAGASIPSFVNPWRMCSRSSLRR